AAVAGTPCIANAPDPFRIDAPSHEPVCKLPLHDALPISSLVDQLRDALRKDSADKKHSSRNDFRGPEFSIEVIMPLITSMENSAIGRAHRCTPVTVESRLPCCA